MKKTDVLRIIARKSVLAVSLFLIIASASELAAFDAANFSLGFGKNDNEVMYYNSKSNGFEDPYPGGPNGFCIFDKNRAAVVDTFGNSLKIFDESGKLIEKINVAEIVKKENATDEIYLSSVAAVKNEKNETEFIVSDTMNAKIYKISGGKLVRTFGKRGENAFEFGQVEEVAAASEGRIAAYDHAKDKLCVFSKDGAPLDEYQIQQGGIYAAGDTVYTLSRLENGTFAAYGINLASKKTKLVFRVQNPSWRNAKIAGVDKYGNFMIAFFEDAIQDKLLKENERSSCSGFFSLTLVSPCGQIMETHTIPVTTPLGNQFFFDAGENKLYYQEFNADAAPEGKYTIKHAAFKTEFSENAAKLAPADIINIKKSTTDIEYGTGRNKIGGNFESVKAHLPILRTDSRGYFYILDAVEGKLICIEQNFASLKTVELSKMLKSFEKDTVKFEFTDLFVVSSSEIYLLDQLNRNFYKMVSQTGLSETVSYDVKKFGFAATEFKSFDRIFANKLGEVILYSSLEGKLAYFEADGKLNKTVNGISAASFFVMSNSDILSLSQNEKPGEVKVDYLDFYRNPLERFQTAPADKITGVPFVSAAHVMGIDQNLNIFTTLFDGVSQKISVYSITGDRVCDVKFAAPQIPGFFERSCCVGSDGTIYLGVPSEAKFHVIRVPYASVIDFVKADFLKKKNK